MHSDVFFFHFQERNIYLPLAENGSALYFMISDLAKINMYRFSLAAFLRLFQRSLDTRQDGGGTEHRIKMLVAHLQQLVYEYVCRSLFKADRLMCAMHMVQGMKPDMFEENVSMILFNLIHKFETIPNLKKLQTTIEMWLLNEF